MLLVEEASRCVATPEFGAEAMRPGLRVAVRAGRRHPHATPPGVEGVMRPLDSRVFGHGCSPYSIGAPRYLYEKYGSSALRLDCALAPRIVKSRIRRDSPLPSIRSAIPSRGMRSRSRPVPC